MVFLILDFKPTVRPFKAVKEKDSRVQWVLFGRFYGFYFNATILELGICFARLQKIMTRTLIESFFLFASMSANLEHGQTSDTRV